MLDQSTTMQVSGVTRMIRNQRQVLTGYHYGAGGYQQEHLHIVPFEKGLLLSSNLEGN